MLASFLVAATLLSTSSATHDGRDYFLYTPASLPAGKKVPLLVVLHGGMGNARYMQQQLPLSPQAEKHGFLVAYLNGWQGTRRLLPNARTWNAGGGCCGPAAKAQVDDAGYVEGFVKAMVARQPVDPGRVFLVGHSNGAIMAYRVACEKTELVSAVVALSGPLMVDQCRAPGLRVLHIHGALDDHVPVTGGSGPKSLVKHVRFRSVKDTERILKDAGADFRSEILPDAGHSVDSLGRALTRSGLSLPERIARFLIPTPPPGKASPGVRKRDGRSQGRT